MALNYYRPFIYIHLFESSIGVVSLVTRNARNSLLDEELRAYRVCSYCSENVMITQNDLCSYYMFDRKWKTIIKQRYQARADSKLLQSLTFLFETIVYKLGEHQIQISNLCNDAYKSLVRIYLKTTKYISFSLNVIMRSYRVATDVVSLFLQTKFK